MSIKITPQKIAEFIIEQCPAGVAEQIGEQKLKMCSIAMACELGGDGLSLGNAIKMSNDLGIEQASSGLHNAARSSKASGIKL